MSEAPCGDASQGGNYIEMLSAEGVQDATVLDRDLLGCVRFWQEMRKAARSQTPVQIRTAQTDVRRLPIDLRALLRARVIAVGAVVGLTPVEIALILKVTAAAAAVVFGIYMVSQRYSIEVEYEVSSGRIRLNCQPTAKTNPASRQHPAPVRGADLPGP